MKIQNVTDASFRKYGKIITEYSFEKILKEMETRNIGLANTAENISYRMMPIRKLLRQWNSQNV